MGIGRSLVQKKLEVNMGGFYWGTSNQPPGGICTRLSSQVPSHITAKPLHKPCLILSSQHSTPHQKCGSRVPQHLYAMLSGTPKQSQANTCVTGRDTRYSSLGTAQNGTEYHTLSQSQALNSSIELISSRNVTAAKISKFTVQR